MNNADFDQPVPLKSFAYDERHEDESDALLSIKRLKPIDTYLIPSSDGDRLIAFSSVKSPDCL